MDAAAGRILLRRVLVSAGFAVAAVAGYELFAQPASAAPTIDQQPLTGAVVVDVVAVVHGGVGGTAGRATGGVPAKIVPSAARVVALVQGLLPVPPLTPPPSLPVVGLPSLAQRPEGAPAPNLD